MFLQYFPIEVALALLLCLTYFKFNQKQLNLNVIKDKRITFFFKYGKQTKINSISKQSNLLH